jgi:hypothetical protein
VIEVQNLTTVDEFHAAFQQIRDAGRTPVISPWGDETWLQWTEGTGRLSAETVIVPTSVYQAWRDREGVTTGE